MYFGSNWEPEKTEAVCSGLILLAVMIKKHEVYMSICSRRDTQTIPRQNYWQDYVYKRRTTLCLRRDDTDEMLQTHNLIRVYTACCRKHNHDSAKYIKSHSKRHIYPSLVLTQEDPSLFN